MDYIFISIVRILTLIIVTQSYNLVLGYTGMVHVGHVAFMALGAYTSALLTLAGQPFWIGLIAGIVVAALAGLFLGIPTVRFRDDYLVAATLGMGEIIRLIILNERELTGGSTGLPKIARPELLGMVFHSNLSLMILTFIVTLLVMAFVWRVVHSPFGKALESIREDEIAAQSLGIHTSLKKLQVLVIAAAIAGLAGVFDAHTTQFIDPEKFNIHQMIFVFLMLVFGGSGTFFGPIVGVAILYTLFEVMRFVPMAPHVLGPLRWILFAILLIVIIIFKPTGIMGKKLVKRKL